MRLSGQSCLITGASRGLGQALARLFWQEGASVCLSAREEEALRSTTHELEPFARPGQHCMFVAGDLSDPSTPGQLVKRACSRLGRIDVLVNNAASQGPIGPLWENDLGEWERCLRLNLLAPAALCAAVVPGMKNQGRGKIINLSGGGATSPRAKFTAYAASKTALVRLTETLAHETRSMGIDVNCIAPGVMRTRLLQEVEAAGPERAGDREYATAKDAPGSDEVIIRAAQLCLFLASSESDGITGKLISARWDPWERLPELRRELEESDIYTLRRIVPADRGKDWGEPR